MSRLKIALLVACLGLMVTFFLSYKADQINKRAVFQQLENLAEVNGNFVNDIFANINNTLLQMQSLYSSMQNLSTDDRNNTIAQGLNKIDIKHISPVLHHVAYFSLARSSALNPSDPNAWQLIGAITHDPAFEFTEAYGHLNRLFAQAYVGESFTMSTEWQGSDSTYGFFVHPVEYAGSVQGVLVGGTKFIDNGFAIVEAFEANSPSSLPEYILEITHRDGSCVAIWDFAVKQPYSCASGQYLLRPERLTVRTSSEDFFGSHAKYHSTPFLNAKYQYFDTSMITALGIFVTILLAVGVYATSRSANTPTPALTKTTFGVSAVVGLSAGALLALTMYLDTAAFDALLLSYADEMPQQVIRDIRADENGALSISWWLVSLVALLVAMAVQYFSLQRRQIELVLSEKQRTVQALLEAEQVKTRFLSNMSHELRTPLNGISGMAQILKCSSESEECQRFADKIHKSCIRMDTLFDDFLNVEQLQQGHLSTQLSEVDLFDISHQIGELMLPAIIEKELTLHLPLQSSVVPRFVMADAAKLRKVLLVLVSNAVAFTKQGDVRIEIDQSAEDSLTVSVKDTGSGISRDAQGQIFDMFFQQDDSLTRPHQGVGAGLYIAKGFVKAMSGSMGFESLQGSGSHFWFTLPTASVGSEQAV